MRIDVSRVERIDAAALQLLAAFVASLEGQRRGAEFVGESATFFQAAKLLGMADTLALHSPA